MLSREHRLDSEGVSLVMSKGRVVTSPSFLFRVLESKNAGTFKLAAVAPKKIFKTAVLRNKVKRRTRAALFSVLKHAGLMAKNNAVAVRSAFFGIFIANQQVLTAPFSQLTDEIQFIFEKSGIL